MDGRRSSDRSRDQPCSRSALRRLGPVNRVDIQSNGLGVSDARQLVAASKDAHEGNTIGMGHLLCCQTPMIPSASVRVLGRRGEPVCCNAICRSAHMTYARRPWNLMDVLRNWAVATLSKHSAAVRRFTADVDGCDDCAAHKFPFPVFALHKWESARASKQNAPAEWSRRTTRYDPPTLEEAITAAQGLLSD